MNEEQKETIKGWFNQVLGETSKIRQQNTFVMEHVEPALSNTLTIIEQCNDIEKRVKRITTRLDNIESQLDLIQARMK